MSDRANRPLSLPRSSSRSSIVPDEDGRLSETKGNSKVDGVASTRPYSQFVNDSKKLRRISQIIGTLKAAKTQYYFLSLLTSK